MNSLRTVASLRWYPGARPAWKSASEKWTKRGMDMVVTRRQFLTRAGGTLLGVVAAPRLLQGGTPIVSAQAIPGAPSFRGAAGKSIQGPVSLNAGMAVLRAQHNGTSNFSTTLFLPDAG